MGKIKSAIYYILCNQITGALLLRICRKAIPDLRWKKFHFVVKKECVSRKQIASIFWGFYESAEIRFIEKYLDNRIDVIELGGSIGVVSSHIVAKLCSGFRLISIEANPHLIELINTNVSKHRGPGVTFDILNYAICYDVENVRLSLTNNNTETRILKGGFLSKKDVVVGARTLGSIVNEFRLTNFALVCDIEGSEIEMLLNESYCLQHCQQLFIELHETTYNNLNYSVSDLVKIIEQKHKLIIKAQHGPVFYFSRGSQS